MCWANLTFVLVMVVGVLSYLALPRQQDPTINFNWIIITTVLRRLRQRRRKRSPTRSRTHCAGAGRQSVSCRQQPRIGLQRAGALRGRRRAHVRQAHLRPAPRDPEQAGRAAGRGRGLGDPRNHQCERLSATIAVVGQGMDENLRRQARNVREALERLDGVDRVDAIGLPDPNCRYDSRRARWKTCA